MSFSVSYVMITDHRGGDLINPSIASVVNALEGDDDFVITGNTKNLTPQDKVKFAECGDRALGGDTSFVRNYGYEACNKNSYVIFIDDDVIIPPSFRQNLKEYVEGDNPLDAFNVKIIAKRGFATAELLKHDKYEYMISLCVIFRKEVFEEMRWDNRYGYYKGPTEGSCPEDVKMTYDVMNAGYRYGLVDSIYIYVNDDNLYFFNDYFGRTNICKTTFSPIRKDHYYPVTKNLDFHLKEISQLV